ncbi:MAG: tetratricopeptide repeat protein [Nitrospirae bacterium]|nr:tetratricopeptide repeat protein [Nitrospirota bacterium]
MSQTDRLFAQASQALQMGDHAAAERLLREVTGHDRRHAPAFMALGLLLARQRRTDEAARAFQGAARANPTDAAAHFNLGNALMQAGDRRAAIAAFREAVRRAPDAAPAYNGLASALRDLGDLAQAVTMYRKAIALDPRFADAHNNLGIALRESGDLDGAIASYRQALTLSPRHVEALSNLGNALTQKGDHDAAIDTYNQALTIAPGHAETHYNLANTLVEQGDLDGAERHFSAALATRPDDARATRNLLFTSTYNPRHDADAVKALHVAWGEHIQGRLADAAPRSYPNPPHPERTIRVGLVSPDLRKHAVAFFIEPLLAHADRDRLRITCYANVANPDGHTARLKGLADAWRDTLGASDADVAAAIRADGIDILIDLAGHTAGGRLPLFARRPAPVQASYLGYPATTGLAAIGHRLTDRWCDPPEAARWYVEQLEYIDGGFCAFQPPDDAPPVAPPPAMANGFVTFGTLLNLGKINPGVVALWARVLHAVPDSRLFMLRRNLAAEGTRRRYLAAFAEHGIPAGRLTLAWEFEGSHLAQYAHMDIALDTLPFCGHTSTCEALWMGVPTLTLTGRAFSGRMGASIHRMAGLEGWTCADADGYVQRASELAADPAALAGLRAALRERSARSRLCDGSAFATAFEAALRRMWRLWCEKNG